MRSIKVYGADEIIDDIKKTAQKLGLSASRYLINFHIMEQENKYPDADRGSRVSLEVVKSPSPKKTIQERIESGNLKIKPVQSLTGWSGGYSKNKQVGKKGA